MTRNAATLSEWAEVMESAGSRRLNLLCTNEVAGQVERALGSALGRRLPLRAADQGEWTHRYPLGRPITEAEKAFLDLLGHLLTLRLGPPVDVAIALDWYQDPKSNDDPNLWAKTRVGELVYGGKYAGSDAKAKQLALELSQVIAKHPDLSQADLVVSVPSHSPRRFSERLAAAVASVRGLPVTPLTDNSTSQVKDTRADDRAAVSFGIDRDGVAGHRVLLIDDVCRTGESLRSAASFLLRADAKSVCVLVAVRTMRN